MAGAHQGRSPSDKEILNQLEFLLQSDDFSSAERLKGFLSYVVEETLAGRGKRIKAYNIGVEVFELGRHFDPALNSTIRVHAGRLRAKLEHYYSHSQSNDKVRIAIPIGSYLPTFHYIEDAHNGEELQGLNSPISESFDSPAPGSQTNAVADSGRASANLSEPTPYALSVLVLPFFNIVADPSLCSFLQGLTKALVMDLNRFGELKLFTKPDASEAIDIYEEAKKVGARFILDGSVQLVGADLRLHMDLIDTSNHGYVWTDKFDSQLSEASFALQDSIASQIVARIAGSFGSINRALFEEQLQKPLEDLDVQESMLYYHNWVASLSPQSLAKVKIILEHAVEQNPNSAILKAMLSDMYGTHYKWGLKLVENDLELSLKLANEALELDNRCRYAHWAKAYNCFIRKDKEGFVEFTKSALELNPYDTNILASGGVNMVLVGNTDEGMEMVDSALRLNPHIPRWHRIAPFIIHYLNGEYEQALSCVKYITPNNDFWMHLMRAAAYGQLHDLPAAQDEIQKLLHLSPGFIENSHSILSRFFFQESIADKIMEGLELGMV